MSKPLGGPRRIFLTAGQRFGKGVIIDPDPEPAGRRRMIRMLCDCGTEYTARFGNVTYGITKSCGCLKANGLRHHPLRAAWYAMIYRCENPATRAYPRYGGRGIRVCEQWHDFLTFEADISRLIGPRPEGCTLDRIDNNGNYEPGNVRWATNLTQRRNQQDPAHQKLTDQGALALVPRWQTGESVSALAREIGVHNSVLNRRLHKVSGL